MSRRLRLALGSLAATALLLALAVGATAYFAADGAGNGRATIATLPAPTITTATAGSASVRLSWTAVTAPGPGTVTYYVTRDNGTPAGDCPVLAAPTTVTSCTDTGVSLARHDYTVTAKWRSWTGRSATTSVTVTNGPATQLVFTTQPGGNPTGGVAFPTQPVVTARDANGNTVADYSGTVALSPRGGSASGLLSGCTATLTNGVTSFSGCAIDRSSVTSYFLRASDGRLTVDSSTFIVRTGPVAQFAFTQQPGNGTGGSELSTRPIVTARDAGGNTVTSYSGTPRLSIVPGTGTAGAVLSLCDVQSQSSGATEFDDCEIDRAGTGYRLRATDGAATGDSTAFNVTVGSVFDLRFTTQPGGGATGGLAFPTQPVVAAVDAGGNTVTSYTSTVSMSISDGGDRDADLTCPSVRAVGGVATFSGCSIDLEGDDYELRASDGFRSEDSALFDVTTGPLARFAFTSQPSSVTAGSSFSATVAPTDAGGNAVSGYSGTVTLSGDTLSGCSGTLNRSNGTTSFSGCRVTRAGSGYVLHASDGTHAGDSSGFTVNPASVSTIAFTTQPGGGATGGSSFPTQPVVSALDAFGNVATSYTSSVSLSIASGGARGATLSTCSSVRASSGVARFSSCEIDRAGNDYVLRASDGTRSALSAAFNVTAGAAASLQLSVATSTQAAGTSNDLTITALDAGGNVATSYAGARSLTFTGASTRSPSGASPTVTDSSGTPVAFGSGTSITFTAGVARAASGANGAMVLRLPGSYDINVDSGPLDNDGGEPTVTVTTGAAARLAWTAVSSSTGTLSSPCYFTCTKSNANDAATFQARVAVTDSEGNIVSGIGSNHRTLVSTPASGAGSGGRFSGSVTSVTLIFASSGSAITTSSFTFTNASGSWTTNTFTATSVSPDAFTAATATVNNN